MQDAAGELSVKNDPSGSGFAREPGKPRGSFRAARAASVLVVALGIGFAVWWITQQVPSWTLAVPYGLLGLLALILWRFPLSSVPGRTASKLWEGLLLFAVILAIRLPGYATAGLLPEKAPLIVATFLWIRWIHGWSWADVGWSGHRLGRQILFGLGFVLLYWLLYQGVFALFTGLDVGIARVQWWTYPPAQAPIPGMDPLLFAALLFLFSNFAEELFFRGFLLREVRFGSRSLWGPFLFQAILFGLYHINYGLFPAGGGGPEWGYLGWYLAWTFLFGLGFGFAYLLSGSLISNTIFHVAANLMQSTAILLFVPVRSAFPTPVDYRNASVGIVLLIVTGLFTLVLGILYALQRRQQRARQPT